MAIAKRLANDGEGFALFAGRNAVTGNNLLRKVTRLLKYLRDIKGTFSAKSVLLATLSNGRACDADGRML
jgi:hypothetical protein